jgi:hypothetical protein
MSTLKPGPLNPITLVVAGALLVVTSIGVGNIVNAQTTEAGASTGAQDITNVILTNWSADCADYAPVFTSNVTDIQKQKS